MIFNDQKNFVGKRIDNQEAWQMPQGGVDRDEDSLKPQLKESYLRKLEFNQ